MRAIAHLAVVAALTSAACKRYDDDPEPGPPPGNPGVDPRLVIAVDKRVELVSIVSRLAGYPEYSEPASTPYARAVDQHFAAWKEHPAVVAARGHRAEHGIGFNAPASLAVYLDDHFVPRRPLILPLPGLDARWDNVDLDAYVAQLQDFARQSELERFLAAQAPFTAKVEAKVRKALDGYRVVDWFESLFGPRRATFVVAPGMLTGTHAFGVFAVDDDGREEIMQVLYLPPGRDGGLPHPDRSSVYTLVHEFAHSYVNPALDARGDVVLPALEPIFPRVAEAMKRQHYPTATIVANESMVRALVVLYARDRGAKGAEHRRLFLEVKSAFLWTADVVKALDAARKAAPDGVVTPDALARATAEGLNAWAAR